MTKNQNSQHGYYIILDNISPPFEVEWHSYIGDGTGADSIVCFYGSLESDDYDSGTSLVYALNEYCKRMGIRYDSNETKIDVNPVGHFNNKCILKSDGTAIFTNELGTVQKQIDLSKMTSHKLGFGAYCGGLNDWHYLDKYIIVKKYADKKPSISISQINPNTWKIIISNPNDYNLTGFQVKIDGTGIVSSKTDGILITNNITSNYILKFNIIPKELRPHNPITINIINTTGNISEFLINWGDGAITEIPANETTASHTYDRIGNFKICMYSIDNQGNNLAMNSTTIKVDNLDEIPYKYLIKVANPTNQNYTNYPLKISLDAYNFDFLLPKPLGTDIYFRDANGTIYNHYIENYSLANQKATIWVQVPYIPPNNYAEFYLCIDKDGHDRAQHTFDTSGTIPQILYTVIPDFVTNAPSQTPSSSVITRLSSNTNNYQNLTIVFMDDMTYLKKNEHKGTIKFLTGDGEQVLYGFNRSYVGGRLEVPASNNTGLCTVTTTDGIVRKIKYNVSNINIILLPGENAVPVLLKGASGKKWFVCKSDGVFVTLADDDSVVYLAPGGEYDFYVGNTPIKKGYTVLGNGDVIYANLNPTYYPKLITTIKVLGNNSANLTVTTNKNITINFSDNTEYTIGAGETRTFTKPYNTSYAIYYNGELIKSGVLKKENWGLLGEFPQKYPTLAHWAAFGIVILALLTGSFITIYLAVPMAVVALLILARLGWIQLDPLSSSIFTLIGIGSFVYFFMKRNW